MDRAVPLSPARERSTHEVLSAGAMALSFVIVVIAPTLLWTAVIFGLSHAFTATLSAVPIALIAAALSCFLTLVWAVLLVNRAHQH